MKKVEGVTITGTAEELAPGNDFQQGLTLLKERHPYMREFIEADSTALFKIDAIRYFYVTRFQAVAQWTP